MHHEGQYFAQDSQKSAFYYEQAARQGSVFAQYVLGDMYYDGDGIEQDHKKAAFYYEQAAKQGFALAEYYLGMMYYHGQGVERDEEKSEEWTSKAAEHCDIGILLQVVASSESARKAKKLRKQGAALSNAKVKKY